MPSERPVEQPVVRPVNVAKDAGMLKAWSEEVPPRLTWVTARYGVLEPDHIVKTCKHGCCVVDPLCGPMLLPRYWRLATEDEVRSVGGKWTTPNAELTG